MISVCIPVYNFKIGDLLTQLVFLLQRAEIEYEILIVEDASETSFSENNLKVAESCSARYIYLNENIGRSAIRNYLCKEAQYPNLLFLDCDSLIITDDFISNYSSYLNKNKVVYGGTKYHAQKPEKKYLLHWNYGRKREIKPVTVRNKYPSQYFKTNNFLIPKTILINHPFNEQLKGYGHEDTLMGVELSQFNIPVYHIDNAVLHAGLETNEQFVLKTQESIRNLLIIREEFGLHGINRHFKLLDVFSKIQNLNLVNVLSIVYKLSQPLLLFLLKNFYLMKVFDFYKLGFLCSIYKKSTALSNDAFSVK